MLYRSHTLLFGAQMFDPCTYLTISTGPQPVNCGHLGVREGVGSGLLGLLRG